MLEALNSANVGQIVSWLLGIIAALSVCVEITPIKINPVSAVLGWLGKRLNAATNAELKIQKKTLEDLALAVDQNEIDRIRWEIFSFADSCQDRHRHTKKEFDHIISLNQKYHGILAKRGMTNGQVDLEFEFITTLYKRCEEQNDFL